MKHITEFLWRIITSGTVATVSGRDVIKYLKAIRVE